MLLISLTLYGQQVAMPYGQHVFEYPFLQQMRNINFLIIVTPLSRTASQQHLLWFCLLPQMQDQL